MPPLSVRVTSLSNWDILSEQFCSLVVQRIIRVWFVIQIDETINDRVDVQDRFPVFSQNVQTNFALQINVGVVNLRVALNLWRRMRVVWRDCKGKMIFCSAPVASVWTDGHIKGSQVIRVWEIDRGDFAAVQLGNVFFGY
jgi:hypothetical protein